MRLVIFGLTISSSWGNGHATLWRGLGRSLAERGHALSFFEKNVPYYAEARDLAHWPDGELILYDDWSSVIKQARTLLQQADVALITSYCPDAVAATRLLSDYRGILKVFYDMDTPVTIQRLCEQGSVEYLPPNGFRDFDLVLSFAGGSIPEYLRKQLGAGHVEVLYGHADGGHHYRQAPNPGYRGDLSYLGTFAPDRQSVLEEFFVQPARRLPDKRFVLGGALYPDTFPWRPNIYYVRHLPPSEHGMFYSSSSFSLNITRRSMVRSGYCPSGRLFEAAACRAAVITDRWPGLEYFFQPGEEIIVADTVDDVLEALALSSETIETLGQAAYARFLRQHSSDRRAIELEEFLQAA
jgi:spore maturation protein CgeB